SCRCAGLPQHSLRGLVPPLFTRHQSDFDQRFVDNSSIVKARSYIKILRLWMVSNYRIGRLLGIEHEILRQLHADRLRVEQLNKLLPIFQIRAGGVSKAIAAAAIALLEVLPDRWRIFRTEAQLLAHYLVP